MIVGPEVADLSNSRATHVMKLHSRPKSLRILSPKKPKSRPSEIQSPTNSRSQFSQPKMQQRFWSPYSSRVPEDQAFATVGGGAASQQQQPQLKHHHNSTPRASADELPVYDQRSGAGKKEGSSRSVEKWVHAIPVIVFFCLFVLWWFSVSVKVASVDGRITSVVETEIPLLLNETRIDIAILAAVAMSPVATVPQNLTVNNATEVPSGGQN